MPDHEFKISLIVHRLKENASLLKEQKNNMLKKMASLPSRLNQNTDGYETLTNSDWNTVTKTNLFASCYLWSMSGFVVYLVIYYSKYFEGNFYVNYAIQGFSDTISLFYVGSLSKMFMGKNSLVKTLKFLVLAMIILTVF